MKYSFCYRREIKVCVRKRRSEKKKAKSSRELHWNKELVRRRVPLFHFLWNPNALYLIPCICTRRNRRASEIETGHVLTYKIWTDDENELFETFSFFYIFLTACITRHYRFSADLHRSRVICIYSALSSTHFCWISSVSSWEGNDLYLNPDGPSALGRSHTKISSSRNTISDGYCKHIERNVKFAFFISKRQFCCRYYNLKLCISA